MKTQYLIFSGPVSGASAAALTSALLEAYSSDAVSDVVVALSSTGGNVLEGIALHNLIRGASKPVKMHAIGNVESIAITLFLSADERLAVPSALFLFHPMTVSYSNAVFNIKMLKDITQKLEADEQRLGAIWRERTLLSEQQTAEMFERDRLLDAYWAREHGFVHAVDALLIPPGALVKQIHT